MARSMTVDKRENEKKRLAKRAEKQKKKEEKKLSGKASSFEDMIAYVDENGVITSTPPAENIKKEEINQEEILISFADLLKRVLPRQCFFYTLSVNFQLIDWPDSCLTAC